MLLAPVATISGFEPALIRSRVNVYETEGVARERKGKTPNCLINGFDISNATEK